jgi:xylulokinase
MPDAYLGVDVGSTGVKVLLLGEEGVAGEAGASYALRSPQPGWAEEEPAAWWRAVGEATRRALARAGGDWRVRAVGVCSMVPAIVLLDGEGRPVRPAILQNDGRAVAELAAWPLDGEEVLRRTGSIPSLQHVGPRLRWLGAHEPDAMKRARHLLGGADDIVYRMTGVMALETNWAVESGLWDLGGERWVPEYLAAAGIPAEWLPPVHRPGSIAGALTSAAAAELGLRAGTPVLVGSADHIAAALAAGLTGPGDVLLKIGGAGDILAVTPNANPDRRLFLDVHDIPGLFVVNGCMATSGALVAWWADMFRTASGRRPDLAALDGEAAAIPPGSEGLVVLPYFLGEKTPIFDPEARGTIVGLTLAHTAAHIHRAILEAVAYAYRHHLEVLDDIGLVPRRVAVSDGGSRSPLWRQILADVLGREVTAFPQVGAFDRWDDVARFRGPAACATPAEERVRRYDEGYRLYRELYRRLEDFYPDLYAWSRREGDWGGERGVKEGTAT